MNPWLYQDQPFENASPEHAGFVYIITDKVTGKRYLGKKLFWFSRKLPALKGKSRKRTKTVESDWQTYFGSNETIKGLIEKDGPDRFERTILRLCTTKSDCNYFEAKLQFEHDVLLSDDWYNDYILCRISSKHMQRALSPK